MWRSISLRNRLIIIFGSLFALWLAVDAGRLVVEASARARTETQSAMRMTGDFLATAVAGLRDAPDPAHALQALVAGLQNVRHVRVGVGEPSIAPAIVLAENGRSTAPRWFRTLVRAPSEVESFPVLLDGRPMESIVIVADPLDEIDEAWAGARDEMLVVSLLAIAAMGAMSLLVGRAMKPLGVAGATLARLEAGDYAARAEGGGPPEIRNLNAKKEAMTNAFRHSGASRINVSLGFEAEAGDMSPRDPALAGLVIRVADDGRGLQGERAAGMGLAGMRDRVRMLGGHVRVVSSAEGGVAVEARFEAMGDREKFPENSGTNGQIISNN